jgi:anti-sigma regulatory factor (Ser/Thr protein kinase)
MRYPPLPFRLSIDEDSSPDAPVFHRHAPATLENTARCVDALHAWLEARSPGSRNGFHATLIVDELLHNVAMHGGDNGSAKPKVPRFALWLTSDTDGVRIAVHDNGVRFDPLATPPAAMRAPTLNDAAGGLGLVLLRTLLHAAQYQYCAGENRLRILVPPDAVR